MGGEDLVLVLGEGVERTKRGTLWSPQCGFPWVPLLVLSAPSPRTSTRSSPSALKKKDPSLDEYESHAGDLQSPRSLCQGCLPQALVLSWEQGEDLLAPFLSWEQGE